MIYSTFTSQWISFVITVDAGYYGLCCSVNLGVVPLFYKFRQTIILNILKTLIVMLIKMCSTVITLQKSHSLKSRQYCKPWLIWTNVVEH